MSEKEIAKPWISGSGSCTVVIPKNFALKHGISASSKVVIEDTESGLLLRKLDL